MQGCRSQNMIHAVAAVHHQHLFLSDTPSPGVPAPAAANLSSHRTPHRRAAVRGCRSLRRPTAWQRSRELRRPRSRRRDALLWPAEREERGGGARVEGPGEDGVRKLKVLCDPTNNHQGSTLFREPQKRCTARVEGPGADRVRKLKVLCDPTNDHRGSTLFREPQNRCCCQAGNASRGEGQDVSGAREGRGYFLCRPYLYDYN